MDLKRNNLSQWGPKWLICCEFMHLNQRSDMLIVCCGRFLAIAIGMAISVSILFFHSTTLVETDISQQHGL